METEEALLSGPLFQVAGCFSIDESGWAENHGEAEAEELTKEVQVLCDYFVGEEPLAFSYENDGPDVWRCILCWAEVRVVYSSPTTASVRSLPRAQPPDIAAFPHQMDCPVLHARRILELLPRSK